MIPYSCVNNNSDYSTTRDPQNRQISDAINFCFHKNVTVVFKKYNYYHHEINIIIDNDNGDDINNYDNYYYNHHNHEDLSPSTAKWQPPS